MTQVSTNQFRPGLKVEIDKEPYVIINVEFVKPGKGQAFTRTRLKNLITNRVLDKTYKSGEKLELADVIEAKMRMLYQSGDFVVFMDDTTYEQIEVALELFALQKQWLKEDTVYDIIFYNGNVIDVTPPTFMDLLITETEAGHKGDTASGRVLKPAILETGAKIQIPIFVNQGDIIKVDTRSASYVSRV